MNLEARIRRLERRNNLLVVVAAVALLMAVLGSASQLRAGEDVVSKS
jgi:hypothetical protein